MKTSIVARSSAFLQVQQTSHRASDMYKTHHIDIIDLAYPRVGSEENYWHTLKDTPENCSGASIAKVGWVLIEWLKSVK